MMLIVTDRGETTNLSSVHSQCWGRALGTSLTRPAPLLPPVPASGDPNGRGAGLVNARDQLRFWGRVNLLSERN
jgi:hypothetical protein